MKPDAGKLKEHVLKLSEELGPRDVTHPGNLNKVADYIGGQFRLYSENVADQPYMADGLEVRNVHAFLGPETKERIVVGAHYDVAGPNPGADDNASGVAGLLELARLLSAEELPTMMELVSYTLEEPPYFFSKKMGSYIHAKSLKDEGIELKGMLALEMIGFFTDESKSQRFPIFLLRPFYPSTGNFIAVVGSLFQRKIVRIVKKAMRQASPLDVQSINAPKLLPGIALSDHLNYWRNGYQAVMITDTSFYRNPNYHTPYDIADTLDYERMAMVVKGVKEAVMALGRK